MKRSRLSFLVLGMLIICSCEEATEGCLDPSSDNFDVGVRDECCCCCEYPNLEMTFSHRYGESSLKLGEDYLNSQGQTFQVIAFEHFISDIQVREGTRWVGIQDSLEIFSPDAGDVVLIDDVIRLKAQQFNYEVGTFLTDSTFNRVRFKTGLMPPAIYYEADEEDLEHPLQQFGSTTLYDETTGYLDFNITLVNPQGDTLKVTRPSGDLAISQELEIDATKDLGDDLTIVMQIDYQSWLSEINFSTDDLSEMARKISVGQSGSFTFAP